MTGYKDPPKHSQFQKGHSGNPKGRPKKDDTLERIDPQSANALALEESRRLIKIKEDGEIKEIPTIEAALRAEVKSALGGNAYAQKTLINRYERAEEQKRREIAESCKFWREYIDTMQKYLVVMEAKGEPPMIFYPHPDDVIVDDEKGVRFAGPWDQESADRLGQLLKIRDTLIQQHALDVRKYPKTFPSKSVDQSQTALIMVFPINCDVPKRFQLADHEICSLVLSYEGMTMRALEKELYRRWRSLGLEIRRGAVSLPLRHLLKWIELVVAEFRRL